MSANKRLIFALLTCVIIFMLGTVGYMVLEDYTFLDGLYMSVITITTVGFGEVIPLSQTGRIFTTILILGGFGCLGFAGHALAESLLERVWDNQSEKKKMKRKIDQLRSHFILCGYGRVGAAAAEKFREADVDFVIIDNNLQEVEQIRENGFLCIEGDATQETALLQAGIKSARGLLAMLNADPDNLFTVLTARELNPTLHIIARTEECSSEAKIIRAGADSVISLFSSAGHRTAEGMLAATGRGPAAEKSHSTVNAVPQWLQVQEGSPLLHKSLHEVSQEMGREVLGLRRDDRDQVFPDPEIVVQEGDYLFVIAEESADRPAQENAGPRKIVIIDDNPVILKLYSRLFQKAGFHPLTARTGLEGLNLILEEKPPAAVIDFQLPQLSGISICEMVRKDPDNQGVKLVLFTADEQPDTRERALESGADVVVYKSPEASEVIQTVIRVIEEDPIEKALQP